MLHTVTRFLSNHYNKVPFILYIQFSPLSQAMNFFAGLFLLFMPEENAFWYVRGLCVLYLEKRKIISRLFVFNIAWFLHCTL
jgi:hypothetical protein